MDLQNLITKKKLTLKPCKTIETNQLGEQHEIDGGKRTKLAQVLPFVVDTKPDLQVALVATGLYLSSQDAAADIDTLIKFNIGHILSIGVHPALKFDHITYYYCELLDLPESDVMPVINKCVKIIDDNRHGNTLVHCNAGVSRSATVVIAYLMITYNMSYVSAYAKVKAAREYIKPNEGFVLKLKTLNNMVK